MKLIKAIAMSVMLLLTSEPTVVESMRLLNCAKFDDEEYVNTKIIEDREREN